MAAKPFTDVEMMLLSKLSYGNLVSQHFNSDGSANCKVTLAQLLRGNEIVEELYKDYDKAAVDGLLKKADQFTVVKSYADPLKTGFAAFALEGPEKGTVTVAARGTQMGDFPDGIIDLVADLQLGVESETMQQRAMNDFMKDLSSYDSIYLTGHSLGGNLAVSGAVGFEDASKIKGVMTFNAPGQNTAFISKYVNEIQKVESKIINFQNKGDMISDINAPVGEVIYVKSRTKDKIDFFSGFQNHDMKDFEYGERGFQFSSKVKNPSHYLFQSIFGVGTSTLSAMELILERMGYGGILLETKKRIRKQRIENASQQNLVVAERIYMNVEALRIQANQMALEQTVFEGIIQQIRNLVITLKDDHIWDSPATDLFMDNYLELHNNFVQFSEALKLYSGLLKNHSNAMENLDREMANMINNISM